MKGELTEFLKNEKIEYFGVLAIADCEITRPDVIERLGWTPESALLFLLPYYAGETVNISRYAAPRDYHIYARAVGERISKKLEELYPDSKSKSYADSSPINERMAAAACGLGMLGDNRLLINEKYGSFTFIAEILTDISPCELGAQPKSPILRCESCGRCVAACPTGALAGCGECLSAVTQRKGDLTDDEVALMKKHNTVWGCDLCQLACPHNEKTEITPITFFREDRVTHLTPEALAKIDKAEFNLRAFSWRGRKTVERNLDCMKKGEQK